LKTIYFDYNATTPIRPEVHEEMKPWMEPGGEFGNPSSIHSVGMKARAAVEKARGQVATLLGVSDPGQIVFTSGGTEADNMAIKGAALSHREAKHIVTSSIEHHAVLNVCEYLKENFGYRVTFLPVDKGGRVDPEAVARAIEPDTLMVSVMLANNEIGTLQPIEKIGALCRDRRILFHTDAVQAVGKIPLSLDKMPVDLLSLSAHKIYGPKGIGALYIRKGTRLQSLFHGGQHEKNRRAGTENLSGIVGLGAACAAIGPEMEAEEARQRRLRDRLEKGLLDQIPSSRVNGHPTERLNNTAHLSFECVEGEGLLMLLDAAQADRPGLAVSTGSACASGSLEPSHVMQALGVGPEWIHGSVRFSLGKFNTEEDVDWALKLVPPVVARLREMSPLWQDKIKRSAVKN